MNTYQLPDITGINPNFLKANIPYFVFQVGMKIEFPHSAVFVDSIRLRLTDGSKITLKENIDWVVNPEDIDELAMSRAFLADHDFSKRLVKSVTLISTKALRKTITADFQQFYSVNPEANFDDGAPLEFTPAFAKALVSGLADARQQTARVYSPVASADQAPRLLKFDINKERSENGIDDEIVPVNTAIGTKVIRPTQGAYFGSSIVVKYNGRTLTKGEDYFPFVVSPLTKETTDKGGIYQFIHLIGDIIGTVSISYHAVGGDVQPSDITSMYEYMVSIRNFLSDEIFITADTIVETTAFRAIAARQDRMENIMRSLLTGAPSYGDANTTAGESVVRPITTVDSDFHWWTIADLYKVEGAPNDIISADQFKGRVFFPGAKVALAFTADVNLNQSNHPVSFKTDSVVFDPTYTLFGNTSVAAPIYPLLRLVWNESGQTLSGASLQIGIALTSLSDRMVVENFSSPQSCWLLNKTGESVSGNAPISPSTPRDGGFVLPDGQSTWSSTSNVSKSRIHVPAFDNGYLVYSGSGVTLAQLAVDGSTSNLFNVKLPKYFPVRNVQSMLVTFASPDNSVVYDVEVKLPRYVGGSKKSTTDFVDSAKEHIALSVELYQNELQVITLTMNATRLTAAAAQNSMTDVVRYVRVKV